MALSYVSLTDGISVVNIPGEASLDLQVNVSLLGDEMLREVHGGALIKQCFYQKKVISVSGAGPIPPSFLGLNWIRPMTLTVPLGNEDPVNFSVFSTHPTVVFDHGNSNVRWNIRCEEQ